MAKTLLVGWDAACWEYLDPLLESGKLPTLTGLIRQGVRGVLASTMPPWTPTAWSTIITGKNPGKHGVFDMFLKRPGSTKLQPTNATLRSGAPFWQYLNRAGVRTGLVNVPFSYPPEPLDGFSVCGFGTPSSISRLTYPDDATDKIRKMYPEFKPEVDTEVLRSAGVEEIFQVERRQQEQFVEIAVHLADEIPVDVLVINLMFPDHANHKMPSLEQVYDSYIETDAHLDRLIERFQPDNIMLLSDHGSSRLKGDFWLAAWLRDAGYLAELENTRKEQDASLNWLLMQRSQVQGKRSGWLETIHRKISRIAFRSLPTGIRERLWDRLEQMFPHARDFVRLSGKVDPARSELIPGSAYSGLLYLNTAVREPDGQVHQDSALDRVETLRSQLLMIEDPETGEPLFSNIYFKDEIYAGDKTENAPDLILDAYDSNWNIRTGKYTSHPGAAVKKYFYKEAAHRDYGWHSRDGILVFSGPDFEGGRADQPAALEDIGATILHLHGVPIPQDFDGRVLLDLFSPPKKEAPVEFQIPQEQERQIGEAVYSEQDADKLTDHLRALGYLE